MKSPADLCHSLQDKGSEDQARPHHLIKYCHIAGGLAKGVGLSGFRIGIGDTHNSLPTTTPYN